MPTVTLNRKTFETLVGVKLKEDELRDRISMLGTDLDDVTAQEIIVEVFPNRPDMLSEQGFARAFCAFIGKTPGLREYKITKGKHKVTIEKAVGDVRGKIACSIVRGLKLDDERIREIIQLQEKLHTTYGRNRQKCAIGIYPLETIKLPITYTAKSPSHITFRPLESDHEMTGTQILESHPTGKMHSHLLEGCKHYPVFYDASDNILSMPPIINSHLTGRVTEGTTDVFVECSGHDQEVVSRCLAMIVTALNDMGGTIESMELQYPDHKLVTPDLKAKTMKLDLEYVNKRLGLTLSDKEAGALLEKMGHDYKKGAVEIAAWRDDIMHPLDLVEDIAIAYGYENFEPSLPSVSTVGMEDPFETFKGKIIELLVGLGLLELNTYHIVNEEIQTTKMCADMDLIKLANALNEDYTAIRAWMLPCLVDVLAKNKHHAYPQHIFDIGAVLQKDKTTETGVAEVVRLAVTLAEESADYTKARQITEYLLRSFALKGEFRETEHPSFIPGRVARLSVNGIDVAYVGELSPSVLENFGIQVPVSCFELNLSELYMLLNK